MTTFFDHIRREKVRREANIARLRAILAAGAALLPDDRDTLNFMVEDFERIISAHPGYAPSAKLDSLIAARRLFKASGQALLTLLDEFDAFSATEEFHFPAGREQTDEIEVRIRKEIFCFSELAHSMQDHCRRVRSVWKPPEFDANLRAAFGEDGQHDFVLNLRNAMHHERMFEADWELRWSETKERSSHYLFKKRELLDSDVDWQKGRVFLDAAPEKLDVARIAKDYLARSDAFYNWLVPWCEALLPPAVAAYRQIIAERRRLGFRASWRMMLKVLVDKKIDPMPYLPKYIGPANAAAANKLPPNSAGLADFVIMCMDEHGACDAELRKLVYRLFGVS